MDKLYDDVLKYLDSNGDEFIYGLLIILFSVLVRKVIVKILIKFLNRLMAKASDSTKESVVNAFEKPMRALVVFMGFYIALMFLPFNFEESSVLFKYIKVVFIITFSYGMYHMDNIVSIGMSQFNKKINFETSEILKKFMVRVYHLCIVLICVTVSSDQFDVDISSIVAGLGIAGLAIALAAQDTLGNIFAGITLIVDKPFDVDDLIRSGDVEGVVEDIGFRSTRVRKLTKESVSIPNSLIANSSIVNHTQRDKRRVKMTIGVTYNTSLAMLKKIILEIEESIRDENWVDEESVIVKFQGFGASSLDIIIYFDVMSGDWVEYLDHKQESCFEIMEIFEKNNVEFAFPSQSIYFENQLSLAKKE